MCGTVPDSTSLDKNTPAMSAGDTLTSYARSSPQHCKKKKFFLTETGCSGSHYVDQAGPKLTLVSDS